MTVATQLKRTDFTEGSVFGSILKMGLPSMVGFLAQHLYSMADMFWVSRLPERETAVAAITFCTSIFWMLWSLNTLVGPGSVAVISRRYGERAYDLTEKAIKETFLLKFSLGAFTAAIGLMFLPTMLEYLGAENDALRLAVEYGRIMLVGLPIMFAGYSVFTALRGIANPNWAMGLMLASNVVNAALDPVFIYGYAGLPAMGIQGAAWASVFSFGITVTAGFVLFQTRWTNLRLHLRGGLPVSFTSMWRIVKIGVPAFLGDLSFSGSRLLITPVVAGFGTSVVAAYGAGNQLFNFGMSLLVGMGLGLSSLIGHNVGAAKKDRAKLTADRAIMVGVGIMAFMSVLTLFFGEYYMKVFFPTSPETVAYGTELLRIFAFGFPFFGAFIMLEQVHVGVGLNTPSMIIMTFHGWCLQVLPALIATQVFGFSQDAIWWTLAASGAVSSLIFYSYYRRGRWLTVTV